MTRARCAALAKTTPQAKVEAAGRWYVGGGGIDARWCLAHAHATADAWPAAAVAFSQAADDAARANDARAPHLRVQAGNAWLAADKPAEAIAAFDAALAIGSMPEPLRGEIYIDRARAHVARSDLGAARADLDRGVALVPEDPFGWYASASLAARQGDFARARAEIAKAAALAPGDAGIKTLAASLGPGAPKVVPTGR